MEKNIVIGIEGLVGTGKTTMCKEMLKMLPNAIFLNGSDLYRAIVYVMMQHNNKIENAHNIDIKQVMDKLNIKLKIENRQTVFYCNGQKLDDEDLQSEQSSMAVSKIGGVAKNEKLFEFARDLINKMKQNYIVIISGRGIMKIYPDTDYHFFITADLEERVNRKASQYKTEDREKMKNEIIIRDNLQKKAGFYDKTDKTIEVDVTNCKTTKESIDKILEYIK